MPAGNGSVHTAHERPYEQEIQSMEYLPTAKMKPISKIEQRRKWLIVRDVQGFEEPLVPQIGKISEFEEKLLIPNCEEENFKEEEQASSSQETTFLDTKHPLSYPSLSRHRMSEDVTIITTSTPQDPPEKRKELATNTKGCLED
ncbi:hypothetical protein NPIL_298211 [Nephila pilipes]|uniref:Uncharacterized protein n=1 Tax=Nephila pilipes TaxID=299642 RepID=A0A8X6PCF5_NEPPI|nr:hypothetical protein NPIL_298211 [Nephila pilipes]